MGISTVKNNVLGNSVKNRVLVLTGYNASISVKSGQLIIRERWADQVTERQWPKHACPIRRLIMPQPEGYVTIAAVRWLHEIGAAIVCLSPTGEPLLTSSAPDDLMSASLRRKQAALNGDHGLGLEIARQLIASKLSQQHAVLDALGFSDARDFVAGFMDKVGLASNIAALSQIEGTAATCYWSAFQYIPLTFNRRDDSTVPNHWRVFGRRTSPLSQSPRWATAPSQALLSYLYGVLSTELLIAIHAAGLDSMLGVLHVDKNGRASLAYDLLEPMRGIADEWLIRWISATAFAKGDFFEGVRGHITLMRALAVYLGGTSMHWHPLAVAMVEWFTGCLTQDRVKPLTLPEISIPQYRRGCGWCGRVLAPDQKQVCSSRCARYSSGAPAGVIHAHSERAQAKRREAAFNSD